MILLFFVPLALAQMLAFVVLFLWGTNYGYRKGIEDAKRAFLADGS